MSLAYILTPPLHESPSCTIAANQQRIEHHTPRYDPTFLQLNVDRCHDLPVAHQPRNGQGLNRAAIQVPAEFMAKK
jgi:hypothetical protein